MAPGVTTIAMTRKAPTVCMAATTQAESNMKKTAFRSSGRSPTERAWFSSKKTTIRSFHLADRIARETKPMMATWSVSSGVIARMFPMVIVCTDTATGFTEIMKRPSPKNEVKMMPMITSTLRPDRSERNSIAAAASPPEMKAPSAKGMPSM